MTYYSIEFAYSLSFFAHVLSRNDNNYHGQTGNSVLGRELRVHSIKVCSCLPDHSEVTFRIVNLYDSLVLRPLPMSGMHAATSCDPPTPHHGSEPIDKEQAMKNCQSEADMPPMGLELHVLPADETEMTLRKLPGADYCMYKLVGYL